ncbi:hypothetical protein K7395_24940 [Streptomyces filamentosus]|uniref:Uncharacterized protein n=2 Tax=Streptomyces filamentosus TaxID=67294 RepID=A0ABY4V3B0_STRFL|nr:hypothetical protein [Streptomyces filamentosus]EFE74530.1 predicted protein [Streptomyces filamentosus NRRL 15998]EWS91630.1 hypothetical protein SSIG_02076 [Streptomyces filamentosus NRRL 11379]MYR78660.1 hypothetical protein [Streptomyces sp. SID5466]USC49737.1 hypothetical protein K7395_24940 [Streptomyces filamentosus]
MTVSDAFAAPGRNRPAPSPAAVALAAQCRRAKSLADTAPDRFNAMPTPADASAAGGEVQLIVRPTCLADWARWTHVLGIHDTRRMTHTGTATVCRFELDGVRARLVGVGVPALFAQTYGPKGAPHA